MYQCQVDLRYRVWGFPGVSVGKETACSAGDPGSIPGLGRPYYHSGILAWEIPWTGEPGGLSSMGSLELDTT